MPFNESDLTRDYEQLLWRAPELLRQTMPPQGTQVFSQRFHTNNSVHISYMSRNVCFYF